MLDKLFEEWPTAPENLRAISKMGADAWVSEKLSKKRVKSKDK